MKTLYTIHGPDAEHLEEVMAQMRVLGAPVVRVVDCGRWLMALEGCHRLMAACRLGVAPVLVVLGEDDLLAPGDLGWSRGGWSRDRWEDRSYTAGELARERHRVAHDEETGGCYRVDDEGLLELVYAGHPQS